MKNRLCTVIIPYYNTDADIFERCMASLGEVPPEVLVLIVDDGSDDVHRQIPLLYQKENIRVIRQENRGVSAARNAGLDRAEGAYVLFLDSDDRAGEGFPLIFCQRAEEWRTQVLFSDITLMPGNRREENGLPAGQVLSGKALAAADRAPFFSFDLCYSVRVCFSLPFLQKHRLRFREDMTISEDMVFNIEALCRADRAAAVRESFYEYWLDTAGSATRAPYKKGYAESLATQYESCRALVSGAPEKERQLAAFYMDFLFYELIRSEKAGGRLTYRRYRALCRQPMFRESIRLLGVAHPCENPKAKLLYLLRYFHLYFLPYVMTRR